MPILPLPENLDSKRQLWWLMAHMKYPDSPGAALSEFVRHLVGSELSDAEPNQEITLPIHWVRALALGPLVEKEKQRGLNREKAGTTSGLLLCCQRRSDSHLNWAV